MEKIENWCEHDFIAVNIDTNKIICPKCGMIAEEFFEKKFNTIEEFIQFKINRIFADF